MDASFSYSRITVSQALFVKMKPNFLVMLGHNKMLSDWSDNSLHNFADIFPVVVLLSDFCDLVSLT